MFSAKMRLLAIAACASAAIALGGCASVGSAGVMAGNSGDPMVKVKITKSDYDPETGRNPITYPQYLAIQTVAKRLQIQINWQTSSNGEACASEGVPYALAGATEGLTTMLYPGGQAIAGPAAAVGGVTYGLGGCVNGIVTHSYDGSYAVGDSLEKALRDIEDDGNEFLAADGRTSLFHDIHVTASFVRTGNRTDAPAPELATHMPGSPTFTGGATGSPVH